ncbi:MAG: hypothetical protein NC191_02535 [Muribaculaceae bacterium]|nr:hypothetical protein [Muribaculaceae bacterium]
MKKINLGMLIFSVLVLIFALIAIWITPFLLVWKAWSIQDGSEQADYLRKAVKYSVFIPQKTYTLEAIMPILVITQNYDEAIEYYLKYEKISTGENRKGIQYLAAYSYFKTGDYNAALNLAKELNSDTLLIQIYTKTGELKAAKNLLKNRIKKNPKSAANYRYIAGIKMKENKWKEAETAINTALEFAPNNIEALQDKVEICRQLGKFDEGKKYQKKLQEKLYKLQH